MSGRFDIETRASMKIWDFLFKEEHECKIVKRQRRDSEILKGGGGTSTFA